ncbi:baseplate J/gp47 family protein [Marinisporobacter balticus]|uniref:Putative phage protein gp47/JayE n=1 Tax=Marinisporobacter balticus TaxID=2018667 RepID=A0A4R2KVP6_9FIRM|nr:baseplate J/gp47 family protein [Marinisporobacter balticus]TCO78014.1 putative phage protein gp47/JayE [Marinisporobacter balticus]
MIEEIMQRMLSSIDDTYDKSEGSFFYDATKPIAIELSKAYGEQEKILDQGFVETATGIYLDKKVAEQGIERKPPTKASTTVIITGEKGAIIQKDMEVASDTAVFQVKEENMVGDIGAVEVLVECEKSGTIGNIGIGKIKYFPVRVQGLTSVTNPKAVTNGYDGESDASLRQRYYDKVRKPTTSGNKHHYRNWAKGVPGVGDARVFPAKGSIIIGEEGVPIKVGNGVVEVVIIGEDMQAADENLINKVHAYIEERRPIGATVNVISAKEIPIAIKVNLKIDKGNYKEDQVLKNIEENIKKYLKDTAYLEGYVSYAKIGNAVLNAEGVLDYLSLEVYVEENLKEGIVEIGEKQVAVLKEQGGVICIKN